MVSIHAPVRARQPTSIKAETLWVSIHAPVRARRHFAIPLFHDDSFNPRAREGATESFKQKGEFFFVSIHAPVRARLV